MKTWLVEIFIYNRDDEYGNISGLYRENKVFSNKNDASKYLNIILKNALNVVVKEMITKHAVSFIMTQL